MSRLEQIRAHLAVHPTVPAKDQRWLLGEVDRLRGLLEAARRRELLTDHSVGSCWVDAREAPMRTNEH